MLKTKAARLRDSLQRPTVAMASPATISPAEKTRLQVMAAVLHLLNSKDDIQLSSSDQDNKPLQS